MCLLGGCWWQSLTGAYEKHRLPLWILFQWLCYKFVVVSSPQWGEKYSLFLRFFPWRDSRIRHFAGYPFGASRKKASTIFYNAALKFQTINPQNTSVMASANGKIRHCHSIWLFHLHSALKIQPFYPVFPLAESIAKTFFGVIPLELQGKNISHFPWHSQK